MSKKNETFLNNVELKWLSGNLNDMFLSVSLQSVVIMLMIFWSRLKPQAPVAVGGGASQGQYYSRELWKHGELYDVLISGQCPGVSVIRDIVTDVTRIINTNTGSLRRKTTLNLETNTEKHNCGRLDFNSVNTNKYFNSQQVSGYIKGLRRQQWQSNLHFTFKFFWETHLFHVSLPSLGSGVEMKSVSFHLLEDKCF